MVLHSAFGTVMRYPATRLDAARFDRRFFDGRERFTAIGSGSCGGKAAGLLFMRDALANAFDASRFPTVDVSIPTLTVITTDVFDRFMEDNDLDGVARSGAADDRLAHAFQRAELPPELVGDLRALVEHVHTPLAVRSSSLLEDVLHEPFAGVYATKMIPNNQHDADMRFRRLVEAIKYVYASTYFGAARDYRRATGHAHHQERMAVIIQEVVGRRHEERFYPDVSGVARSYSFYPSGGARPQDGVVNLALGLGKTIVHEGIGWTYSPAYPHAAPPFGSVEELLEQTQSHLWSVNMGTPPAYDPIAETEYLVRVGLDAAEADDTLRYVCSTYDPRSDSLSAGAGRSGLRVLTFAPLLVLEEWPITALVRAVMEICEDALEAPVEIEFAVTFERAPARRLARFGFLQVRPMVVSSEIVAIPPEEMRGPNVLVASGSAMGNGVIDDVRDVVYVKPDAFEARHTHAIAGELAQFNARLTDERRPYLLFGVGRWGSADPWLGIPIDWSQIAGARAIVELSLPSMSVELSQGSHFFHNLSSFGVSYFSVPHATGYPINWGWLERQTPIAEASFVRHVRAQAPLVIKVDGRSARGVILTRS